MARDTLARPVEKPFDHQAHPHELASDAVIRRRVKAELRKRMRGLRNTFPAAVCAERSLKIVAALTARPEIENAKSIALFWPIEARHEVDLRPLDESLRARGVKIFYPDIDPDTHVMTFRRADDLALLTVSPFGFAAPPKDALEAGPNDLDVIVVPALGVALNGHRIGYGAGYYDRTIGLFSPRAVSIAVAYDFQILAEIPVTEGDVAVDVVVTDARSVAVEKEGAHV